ncbi:MAG: DUF5018 domain-containing protein [Treponema sp.]|jgi:hypothetical protein|nr:DUF5018 domain-containing protein [Treponema sp.]
MRKTLKKGAFLSLALVLICMALPAGLTSCSDEPESRENDITSFKIGNVVGAIRQEAQEISIVVPVGTNLSSLSPVITVSSKAKVTPASGTANDFTNPTTYTVKAENGSCKFYVVTVTNSVAIDGLQITSYPNKIVYGKDEPFNPSGLVVMMVYSDGSAKQVFDYELSGFSSATEGEKEITVTSGEQEATFKVLVEIEPTEGSLNLSINLQGDGNEVVFFGIPEGQEEMIELSWSGQTQDIHWWPINPTLPKEIVISANGYYSIQWYIDNTYINNNNIITIKAENYVLKIPHTVTFTGYRDGAPYSKTIQFIVGL